MEQKDVILNEVEKRFKKLNLHPNVLKDFKRGVLNRSENPYGILYWLTEEEQAKVKEIEKEYNIVVYHVIHHFAEFGECYCMLYLDNNEIDFVNDDDMLEEGIVYAYVWNKDDDICSEFGSIMIKAVNGGVVRIG